MNAILDHSLQGVHGTLLEEISMVSFRTFNSRRLSWVQVHLCYKKAFSSWIDGSLDQSVLSGTCNSIFSFENASAF